MGPRRCSNCSRLNRCELVDQQKIKDGFSCSDWKQATDEELDARSTVVDGFGLLALQYETIAAKQRGVKKIKKRRRTHG